VQPGRSQISDRTKGLLLVDQAEEGCHFWEHMDEAERTGTGWKKCTVACSIYLDLFDSMISALPNMGLASGSAIYRATHTDRLNHLDSGIEPSNDTFEKQKHSIV
jgi:hypothetical protein